MSNLNFPTEIWDMPILEELNKYERLLFIYLFTSPFSNNLGIFRISEKKISMHTQLTSDEVKAHLKSLAKKHNRLFYQSGYVIIPDKLLFGGLNANRKKGIIKDFRQLPVMLIEEILGKDYQPFLKHVNSYLRAYQIIHVNVTNYQPVFKDEKPKVEVVYKYGDFVREIMPFFPEKHQPKTDKNKLIKWHDTVRLLIERDGYSKDQIKEVIIWARNDDFWKRNFYTVNKLRDKVKNQDITVIDYILGKMNDSTHMEISYPEKKSKSSNNF